MVVAAEQGELLARGESPDAYRAIGIAQCHDVFAGRTELGETCRSAMPAHARLLVVELVLPETDEPNFGKWLDLHMLAVARGRERTAAEYTDLLDTAGFLLRRCLKHTLLKRLCKPQNVRGSASCFYTR